MDINKKDLAIVALKTIIYTCTLLLAVLGAAAVTSCSVSRQSVIDGKATIITTDTTFIHHSGNITFPKTK